MTDQNQQNTIITPNILSASYRFERILGEGTNGITWLATVLNTGKPVAIKELKLSDDLKSIDLFMREAETLQSVAVKGVPKFYECIPQGDNCDTSYIVQEFIDHPSLQMALDKGRIFTENEVSNILLGISKILYALQTQYTPPIIHCDIKPANILFAESGLGTFDVWLIDFGAVANPQKQSGGSTIAGTFGYMAPEQLQGECALQSDFYALGATALHLLTGVSPYTIDTELFKLQFEPVLDEHAPKTSESMRALLNTLLAPTAADRPSSASKLLSLIKGEKIEDEEEELPKKLSRFQRFVQTYLKPKKRWIPCTADIRELNRLTATANRSTHSFQCFEMTYTHKTRMYHAFLDITNTAVLFLDADYMPPEYHVDQLNTVQVDCLSHIPARYRINFQTVWLAHDLFNSSHVSPIIADIEEAINSINYKLALLTSDKFSKMSSDVARQLKDLINISDYILYNDKNLNAIKEQWKKQLYRDAPEIFVNNEMARLTKEIEKYQSRATNLQNSVDSYANGHKDRDYYVNKNLVYQSVDDFLNHPAQLCRPLSASPEKELKTVQAELTKLQEEKDNLENHVQMLGGSSLDAIDTSKLNSAAISLLELFSNANRTVLPNLLLSINCVEAIYNKWSVFETKPNGDDDVIVRSKDVSEATALLTHFLTTAQNSIEADLNKANELIKEVLLDTNAQ